MTMAYTCHIIRDVPNTVYQTLLGADGKQDSASPLTLQIQLAPPLLASLLTAAAPPSARHARSGSDTAGITSEQLDTQVKGCIRRFDGRELEVYDEKSGQMLGLRLPDACFSYSLTGGVLNVEVHRKHLPVSNSHGDAPFVFAFALGLTSPDPAARAVVVTSRFHCASKESRFSAAGGGGGDGTAGGAGSPSKPPPKRIRHPPACKPVAAPPTPADALVTAYFASTAAAAAAAATAPAAATLTDATSAVDDVNMSSSSSSSSGSSSGSGSTKQPAPKRRRTATATATTATTAPAAPPAPPAPPVAPALVAAMDTESMPLPAPSFTTGALLEPPAIEASLAAASASGAGAAAAAACFEWSNGRSLSGTKRKRAAAAAAAAGRYQQAPATALGTLSGSTHDRDGDRDRDRDCPSPSSSTTASTRGNGSPGRYRSGSGGSSTATSADHMSDYEHEHDHDHALLDGLEVEGEREGEEQGGVSPASTIGPTRAHTRPAPLNALTPLLASTALPAPTELASYWSLSLSLSSPLTGALHGPGAWPPAQQPLSKAGSNTSTNSLLRGSPLIGPRSSAMIDDGVLQWYAYAYGNGSGNGSGGTGGGMAAAAATVAPATALSGSVSPGVFSWARMRSPELLSTVAGRSTMEHLALP